MWNEDTCLKMNDVPMQCFVSELIVLLFLSLLLRQRHCFSPSKNSRKHYANRKQLIN